MVSARGSVRRLGGRLFEAGSNVCHRSECRRKPGVTGQAIASRNGGAFANIEAAALLYFSGAPTAAELLALSNAAVDYGGAGVLI